MAITEILDRIVEDILWAIFIDGVVCEVHAEIIHILFRWKLILLCGKPDQSFIIDINSQWITTSY